MTDFKEITLTNGDKVKVDSNAYDFLNQWSWNSSGGYAFRSVYPKDGKGAAVKISIHRQIVGMPEGYFVDHINGDHTDNRLENLRVATPSQNQWNRKISKNNKSGHKGITWDKVNNKWRASLSTKDKFYSIGRFTKLEDAVKARADYINKVHGEFARHA